MKRYVCSVTVIFDESPMVPSAEDAINEFVDFLRSDVGPQDVEWTIEEEPAIDTERNTP